MTFQELHNQYNKLQTKYGAKELDSIFYGGCTNHPDICFVFMNPTKRNIASFKTWKGLKAPWIGTKNIWDLFYKINLLDQDIYQEIRNKKGPEWTESFANKVYDNVTKHRYIITNLGKCTQLDARPLPDSIFQEYINLLKEEILLIQPKTIILFGNQVSSIVLQQKISVSLVRKQKFLLPIGNQKIPCYSVYYPVGNGRFNIDKAIEDILWIIEQTSKTNKNK